MNNGYHINYIKREDIDIKKWDQCIDESPNGLIYAYSYYLDKMSARWDALVLNDYDTVMPLTWNKKWGIKYLYQPPFMQQLGIFGKQFISEGLMESFITLAKSKFNFAEIFLNNANHASGIEQRNNYVLDLNTNYEQIHTCYKTDLLNNLKHSKTFNLVYKTSFEYKEAIAIYMELYGKRTKHVTNNDYQNFFDLCSILHVLKMLLVRSVHSQTDELLAIAIFFRDKKRLYNIMSATFPKGRDTEANHFLFDELIREFAGRNILLDFEGSDIPGIAKFYQKFGASHEPYFFLKYNHLHWPLKYLK